jgi:hypothetical protein
VSRFHQMTVPVFSSGLSNMSKCLDLIETHAKTKGFDPDSLVQATSDKTTACVGWHILTACDLVVQCIADLTSIQTPSKSPPTDLTVGILRTRITDVLEFLKTVPADAFENAMSRVISVTVPPTSERSPLPKSTVMMPAFAYLLQHVQRYFGGHFSSVIGALKQFGVPVEQRDFTR